jgi:hypothetical protein
MAGGFLKATGFLAADGALGSAVETGTNNALEGNPLSRGVAHDAVIGAVEAPIFFGATKGLAELVPELSPVLEGTADTPDKPTRVRTRVARTAKELGVKTAHYVKTAPSHHHSALAVALANQFQGWGGQLLQGIWGYALEVPDFWGSGGSSGSSKDPSDGSPAADTSGISGALGHASAR